MRVALIGLATAMVLGHVPQSVMAEETPSDAQLAMIKTSLGKYMPGAETKDIVFSHQSGDPGKRTFVVCGFGETADQRLPFHAMVVEDGEATNASVTTYGFNDRFKSMVYEECAAKGAALRGE